MMSGSPLKKPAGDNGTPLLALKKVCRYFGGIKAVESVDLEVYDGQIAALIGPNGAGKTTAFNVVTRLFQATSGEVELRMPTGKTSKITAWNTDRICRSGVARTFQNIRLFGDLPSVSNVKMGLHQHTCGGLCGALLRWPIRSEERQVEVAAWKYLEFVGLEKRAHEVASSLPYGDQRRLEIARALACQPRLLLLDEPAAGMNPQETVALIELIRKIRDEGIAVLLIEHDMKMVMQISDRIFVLDHGQMIAHGTPDEVRQNPAVIEAYLGADGE